MLTYSVMATAAPKADLRQAQDTQWYLGDDQMRAVSAALAALTNYTSTDTTMTLAVTINVSDSDILIPDDPEPGSE